MFKTPLCVNPIKTIKIFHQSNTFFLYRIQKKVKKKGEKRLIEKLCTIDKNKQNRPQNLKNLRAIITYSSQYLLEEEFKTQ